MPFGYALPAQRATGALRLTSEFELTKHGSGVIELSTGTRTSMAPTSVAQLAAAASPLV
jgi:hypothetical protein